MANYKITIARLIALVAIPALLTKVAFAQPQQMERSNVWAQAEAKIEAHLKSLDPKVHSVEIKSERLKKFLPDFRVFVRFERDRVERTGLILINQDGVFTDLGDENWHGDPGTRYLRVPRLNGFVRDRKIQAKSQEDAVEFTRFFEELQGAPGHVASLNVNAKNPPAFAFEKLTIEIEGPGAEWIYTSMKREGGWKVTAQYSGDPSASIMTPPTYDLDVDEQGYFRDLRRHNSLTR